MIDNIFKLLEFLFKYMWGIIFLFILFIVFTAPRKSDEEKLKEKRQEYLETAHEKRLSGKNEDALFYCKLALEENSKDTIAMLAFIERADVHEILHNYKSALSDLNQAGNLFPKYALIYFLKARVKEKLSDIKGAILELNKFIELAPPMGIIFEMRGHLNDESGDKNAACHDWSKAIELGVPCENELDYCNSKFNLGYTKYMEKRNKERMDSAEKRLDSAEIKIKNHMKNISGR